MAEYIEREAVLEFVEPDARPFLAERINSIPAADVRPVVRGKWEYNPNDNIPYCSECMMPQDSECNFCPNCGADMRSTDCTKTATADEEREVLNVRAWLNCGADMREEN